MTDQLDPKIRSLLADLAEMTPVPTALSADLIEKPPRVSRRRLPAWLIAPAAALAALLAVGVPLLLIGDGGDTLTESVASSQSGTEGVTGGNEGPPSSAQVVVSSVSGMTTLNGEFDVSFAVSEDGDYRFSSSGSDVAYDADALRLEIRAELGNTVVEGLAPAGPDNQHAHMLSYLRSNVISWSVEQSTLGGLGPTTVIGRDAGEWNGSYSTGGGNLDISVVVDSETMLPLRVETTSDRGTSTWEVQSLVIAESAETEMLLGVTKEAADTYRDVGFRASNLETIDSEAGYAPPLPVWLPDGFVLRSIVFSESPGSDVNLTNPPSVDVAVATYRRGFETIVVTSRRETTEYLRGTSGEERPWTDPYCIGFDCKPVQTVVVGGSTFSVVAGPGQVTHAWGILDGLVVTVGGDIPLGDLISVLASIPG